MSGMKIHEAVANLERLIGWGDASDDGSIDLSGNKVFSYDALVTIAQVNTGLTIIPAVIGRKYKVVGVWMQFAGAWAACTDVRVGDTAGTPVVVITVAQAQAGDGDVHSEDAGTNTLGVGFGVDLTESKGVQIYKTGSTATTGTGVLLRVLYKITA